MANEKTPAERVRAHFDAAAAKRAKPAPAKVTTDKAPEDKAPKKA